MMGWEKVRRKATQMMNGLEEYSYSYEDKVKILGLSLLESDQIFVS